jgi:hypothetical protein
LAGDLLHAVDGFDPYRLDESCTLAKTPGQQVARMFVYFLDQEDL